MDDKGKSTVHLPQAECEQHATVEKILYIKEKYISNKAYYELSMVNKDMPRSCSLTKCAKELNTHKSTPGQAHGVQQSLKLQLKKLIEVLLQKNPLLRNNPQVRIKVTGDGTLISRNIYSCHSVLD